MEGRVEALGGRWQRTATSERLTCFVGNLYQGARGDEEDVLCGGASKGDTTDMHKDGYYNILGPKQGFVEALLR